MIVGSKKFGIVAALTSWFLVVCVISYRSLGGAPGNTAIAPVTNTAKTTTANHERNLKDADGDGLPDVVQLRTFNNNQNFRQWFTYIAELQFYRLAEPWQPDQRDCAGLVRFAWREALRRHDHAWYQRMGPEYEPVASDVSVDLDAEPLRGKLFRTSFGPFTPDDLSAGRFSEFADAQTLKTYNVNFVSRDRLEAKPGDLLIFQQPWVQKFPFHIMIFLGTPHVTSGPGHDWVVYHTGPTKSDPGLVKKVRLSTLDKHPDKRWRPLASNPNFLGVFRLKILDQRTERD